MFSENKSEPQSMWAWRKIKFSSIFCVWFSEKYMHLIASKIY